MSWKERAREVVRDSAVELESLPGYKVVIQKFTVAAREKMSAMQNMTDVDDRGRPINMKEGDLKAFYTAVLQGGLIEMREMKGVNGKEPEVIPEITESVVEEILSFPDVCEEIVAKILERNRPLAEENAESSETA